MFSADYLDARLRAAATSEGIFIPQRPTVWRVIKRWLAARFNTPDKEPTP